MSPFPPTDHPSISPTRFDDTLIDQIIEIEVDAAVRRLAQQGRIVPSALEWEWNRELRTMLSHVAAEEHGGITPVDLQKTLTNFLLTLIDADSDRLT